ncbi:cobalamin-dependent protein [Azospirillum oleiclasticum]|uniref:cobalamin-dependent protein n=1 Tax=Azospirillum oleiclasticum TaxID=2735135 RepID=UPI001FE2A72B|nr:cobalamin-dependent protein [Azospirillum oleiclasticum]
MTRTAAAEITGRRDELAQAVVSAQFARRPALRDRYGDAGAAKCAEDLRYHILYLAEAVAADSPRLFSEYAAWVKVLFAGLKIPASDLRDSLEILREVVAERVGGPVADVAARCIAAALDGLPHVPDEPVAHLDPAAPHGWLAQRYLDALLAGDRRTATTLVLEAVEAGLPVRDAYLHVFQPTLREVGRLWQLGRISVAHEHFVTAATQATMSMLYPRIFAAERHGLALVATCVSGEMHEIGIRMVADFFEMAGWDTYYLGANAPAAAVVRAVRERNAAVLAVSATITAHVGAVAELIRQVREGLGDRRVHVIVGGYPFNIDPDLWRSVGADGSAAGAEDAVTLAARLGGAEFQDAGGGIAAA